jgi:hypothetical protein
LIVGDLPNPAIQAPIMDAPEVDISNIKLSEPPSYTKGQALATREAYGNALVPLKILSITFRAGSVLFSAGSGWARALHCGLGLLRAGSGSGLRA